jgi:hypothetical protein
MADFFKLSLVLQAAEMLEQPKAQMLFPAAPALRMRRPAPPVSDDGAVPDVGAIRPARQRSPFAYDEEGTVSDDGSSMLDADELASKRMRLASSRMLARNLDTHNSVEKRRRAYLASCYEGLKDSVPMLAGSRASNVKVLRGAASYIKVRSRSFLAFQRFPLSLHSNTIFFLVDTNLGEPFFFFIFVVPIQRPLSFLFHEFRAF